MLRISGIVDESIVDGPGFRYTIFVQGCPHHCPGCHNPQTHDFAGGELRSIESMVQEIREDPLLSGVTFSGGEPFCQAEGLCRLGRQIKEMGLDLAVYSGYTYEQLLGMASRDPAVKELLDLADLLVDGPFILAERNLELSFRGSSNQRLIDLKAMREAGDTGRMICLEE